MLCLVGASQSFGQTVIKSDWPKSRIPADIPVYPYAGVTDHGPSAEDYWIKVADGKAANVAKYMAAMTAKGWVEERRGSFMVLKKGDTSMEVRTFPDENITMFVVSVFKPQRVWPTKDLPELPELNKGMYTFSTDPVSGTSISVGRLTEAELLDYFKLLATKGWKGDPNELRLTRAQPRGLVIMAEGNGEDEWSISVFKP
jgi:hypothetical protein